QIETRYFRDQRFYEELLALEEELICDYVSGALTPEESGLFEKNFLKSARRRRKYESTKKLMTFIADQSGWQPTTTTQPIKPKLWVACARRLHSFFTPKLSFVWSTVAVATLSLTAWWLSTLVTGLREEVKVGEAQQASLQKKAAKPKTRGERQSAKQRSDL